MKKLERLLELLNQEASIYKDLLGLAGEKQKALINGAVEELVRITGQESDLIDHVEDCEAKRQECLELISSDLAVDTTELTFSRLRAQTDSDLKESFNSVRGELLQVIDRLKDINDQNEILLQESLSYNNFLLELVSELEKSGMTYSKEGSSNGKSHSTIDDRA